MGHDTSKQAVRGGVAVMEPVGFTLVFQLASARRNVASQAKSVALDLVKSQVAERVFSGRAALASSDPMAALYVVPSGNEGSTRSLLEQLQEDSRVDLVYVAPPRDVLSDRTMTASRASEGGSWHDQIRLTEAQGLPQWRGESRVSMAVLDTGLDTAHPQLKRIPLEEHLGRPPSRPDAVGHGTHVAGLIGAQPHTGNSFGGLAPDCADIVAHRGIVQPGDVAGYYRALRAAGTSKIVNLSLGGEGEDPIEARLIGEAIASGAIVVAAMGNSAEMGDPTIYPAALPGVIAVGAVNGAGGKAEFSNTGDHILIAAPGVGILSTAPTYEVPDLSAKGDPPLGLLSGTSMATPIVSAIIARMLAFTPGLTVSQVIDLLEGSGGEEWNPEIGRGVIDAYSTLSRL